MPSARHTTDAAAQLFDALQGTDLVGSLNGSRIWTPQLADILKEARDLLDDPDASDEHADLLRVVGAIEAVRDGMGASTFDEGSLLIPEGEFTEYAQDLAEEIGAIDSDAGWPSGYIDWEAAADALRVDYTEIGLGDDSYLFRA